MKRLLLLTMMCLFGMFSVNAQETVTIGTKSTVAFYFPFHTWWQYSFSQQIYTSAEINHGAANIQKIKFFTDGTNYSRNIKVYMQNIDKKWFDSNTDWVDVTDADIVFEGTIITSTEIEITLDKPFAYAGGNLLLSIHDITNVDNGSSTKFEAYEDNSTRTICMFDDANGSLPGTENATGFGEQHCLAQKTVLQITFDGEGTTPEEPGDGNEPGEDDDEEEITTLAAPVVTATASNDSTIVLTWEAVEGATKYYIYENDEVIGEVTTLFCEMRDFEANTTYCFTVTAANDTIESEMSEPACAKTTDVAFPEEPGDEPEEPGDEPEEPGDEPEEPGDEPEEPGDGEETTLAAPEVTVDTVTATTIVFTWNAIEGAKEYAIYFGEEKLGTTEDTIAGIQGLEPKTEYCITVTAVCDTIESRHSEEACATTSSGEGIEENTSSFSIYPNPVNDKLYIETLTQTQTLTVEIYDMFGRQQSMVNGQQSMVIDVTDLNSGVYFVKVVTSEGESVQRFIKK